MKTQLSIAIVFAVVGCAKDSTGPADAGGPAVSAKQAAPVTTAPPEKSEKAPPPAEKPETALPAGAAKQLLLARIEKAKTDMRNIEMAAKLFHLDYGRLPTLIKELLDPPKHPDMDDVRPFLEVKDGVPLDPWGHEYIYEARGDEIFLQSLGPDGEPGGGDDITIGKE